MKTQKNNIMVFVACILMGIACEAQDSITGTISNYTIGEGVISSYHVGSREKIEIGKIDQEGHFNIPLDQNYLTVIKEQAEIAKDKAPNGWQINFKTVASTFECFGGDMEYQNGEALISGIPDPEVRDKEGIIEESVLYAVSIPEIAQWLFSYRQENSAKGYYLQWYFVEDSATVNGECIVETYTGNGDENYDEVTITNLELQKGWNIIKYNISEVFTTSNGKVVPSKIEISSLMELPDDIQWIKVII